mmetsp:Transcript_53716/g.172173  ORF Transcript_53716/g.172173 Transcript_53716/m.172173 type:complete len:380 (+) Transcript_53716:694-1833(+)
MAPPALTTASSSSTSLLAWRSAGAPAEVPEAPGLLLRTPASSASSARASQTAATWQRRSSSGSCPALLAANGCMPSCATTGPAAIANGVVALRAEQRSDARLFASNAASVRAASGFARPAGAGKADPACSKASMRCTSSCHRNSLVLRPSAALALAPCSKTPTRTERTSKRSVVPSASSSRMRRWRHSNCCKFKASNAPRSSVDCRSLPKLASRSSSLRTICRFSSVSSRDVVVSATTVKVSPSCLQAWASDISCSSLAELSATRSSRSRTMEPISSLPGSTLPSNPDDFASCPCQSPSEQTCSAICSTSTRVSALADSTPRARRSSRRRLRSCRVSSNVCSLRAVRSRSSARPRRCTLLASSNSRSAPASDTPPPCTV